MDKKGRKIPMTMSLISPNEKIKRLQRKDEVGGFVQCRFHVESYEFGSFELFTVGILVGVVQVDGDERGR